ncbi:MAG: hypothetical protein HQL19_01040 [Candidatus Omnitrophica bacterium]|nr:hypothetical protein [Candidatus Omnitrophota bacterium]
MKKAFDLILVFVFLGSLCFGGGKWSVFQSYSLKAKDLEAGINVLKKNEERLLRLRSVQPNDLDVAYKDLIDDMTALSRVYALGLSMEGSTPLFSSSKIEGLNEARVKVVFSRIANRGVLLSLLSALDSSSDLVPFMVDKMIQEKDSISIELRVLGV